MDIRPKMKDYDRGKYDPKRHLTDLINWAEKAEKEIETLKSKVDNGVLDDVINEYDNCPHCDSEKLFRCCTSCGGEW